MMSYVYVRLLPLALCFYLSGCAPSDGPSQFVQQRAYYVGNDPLEINSPTWKPYENDVSVGYGAAPLWIRLNVTPVEGLDPAAHIEISVTPNHLDQIDLYDVGFKPNGYQTVGERFPLSNNAQHALVYTFAVPNGIAPRVIILRVKTASARLVRLSALPPNEARHFNTKIAMAHTMILSLLLVTLCLACYAWTLNAEYISAVSLVLQTLLFLYGALILGFGRLLFGPVVSPEMQDLASTYLTVGYAFANVWFYYHWLSSLGLKRPYSRILQFLLLGFVMIPAVYLFGEEWRAFQLNSFILNSSVLMLIPITIWRGAWANFANHQSIVNRNFLTGYFIFVCVVNALFDVYENLVNGILTSFAMIYVLHERAKHLKADVLLSLEHARMDLSSQKSISESRGLFLSVLIHELKTPLSTIILASAERETTEQMKQFSAQAIRSMVDTLKLSSRALPYFDKAVEPNFESIDAKSFVETLVGAQLNSNRFVVDLNFVCDVAADRQLLAIIINNLFENAIKHSPDGTLIVVGLAQSDVGTAQVSVSNEVSEATSKDVHRFFEKYFRSTDSGHLEGMGLGLYLAKTLVELQLGFLDCKVVANRMSFTLNLLSAEAYEKKP